MEASRAHHIRPTALILGKDSRKRWSRDDILFAKAYQRYKNELCPQCGLPKYVCRTDDNRIQFKLEREECASARVAEKAQHEHSAKANSKPMFGTRLYGEPYLTDDAIAEGLEMSDFRRPYHRELAVRKGLIPADEVSGN